MTHLNIQQGSNVEIVTTLIIKKLYEAALSVPEPLEGELDAAYMSGNLLVNKAYRSLVEYLTNRFDDLHINVTNTYYIDFEDPLVLSVLLANNFSSDGVGITESDAASANLLTKFANNSNITTFNEFKYFTSVNKTDTGSAQTFINCTNLSEIDLTEWEVALLRLFENTAITTVNAPKLSRYGSAWDAVGVFQTNSHLTTVQSLGHVTKITQNMFGGCINLETVNLPQECTTIEKLAFIISYNQGGGHLTTINLDNITTIGDDAFQELRRLAKTLPTDMPSLTSVGIGAFQNCVALTGSINYQNLTSIGERAFAGCSGLNGTINLPNLTSLGEKAFSYEGITSIADLGSITSIPDECFRGCTSLTSVTLPSTVISIGLWAFADCHMTTMDLSHVTSIGEEAFVNSWLTTTDLSNVTSIGPSAFRGSRLTGTLNCPNLVSLGNSAFQLTNITSILSLGTITELPSLCFHNCNISSMNQSVIDQITSWGWLSLPVSGSLATNIKPGPNTKRLLPSIIGVNNPNGVVYLPLITRSLQNNNNLVDGDCHCPFNYRYNSGVARNIYGLIYMPNLSLIEGGYGTFPYQNGLAIDTTADLFYIKSVSTLTPGTFSECNISHIIINNTTPPNLVDTQGLQNETGGLKKCIFSYNGSLSGIYVPDSAVNSYKTAWGDVLAVTPVNNNGAYLSENVIKPISSLNGGIIYATENDWISDGRPSALIAEYMGLNTADLATFVSANNLTYYTPPSS